MLKDQLILLNPWWKTGNVDEKLAKPYKRKVFFTVLDRFRNYRQIIVLTGLRRVGKSTIIYQLISQLLSDGIDPKNILYYSFDFETAQIDDLLSTYVQLTGIDVHSSKIYLFFDEIQKLKNWSSQIKAIYDSLPNARIVLSGSASLQLEQSAINDLAGRHFIIEVKPLSILEFYELKHNKVIERPELYEDEIMHELDDYVLKPFPEIVNWKEKAIIKTYIRESVISKIVRSDLPDIYEKVNFKLLEGILRLFYSNPGMILNLDALAKELGASKTTIETHLFYLEFSKLIRILRNYRPNIRVESRKLKKIYPYDISLAMAYNDVDRGKILETLVLSMLGTQYYWRIRNKEVDFILKDENIPIEVKASSEITKSELSSITYFMKKYNASKGIVIYNGKEQEVDNIKFIPLSKLLIYGLAL